MGDEVPLELLALVSHHCRRIKACFARAQHLQTLHGDSMKQWQRLVLYALSDALAHNHLLSAPSPSTSNARTSTPTCMTTSPPGPPTH
ncbi:hypothetical protein AB0L42_38040 [Streptomyces sp. NPDC052287]|uniref:hypothetical protein n=1 Tax=Streptomyces sp. NPDC052287 TaxID=3154950 RepID=UPI003416E794